MPAQLPLQIQAIYAELVERAHLERLAADFDDPAATFVRRTINGRDYWYFRSPMVDGAPRRDRYVGPHTPELEQRIAAHRSAKEDYKQRRALVSALLRTGIRGPDAKTGRILEALAEAGVFRMRAVVVGTVAYQTYAGLLGTKLGGTNAITNDLDLAQFRTISIAVQDQVEIPFLDILRGVDPAFEPVQEVFAPGRACRYATGDQYRVDLLTPNQGPDDESPVALPALRSDAQPLRFLDFLIYREVQAVSLFGAGIAINVPSPERYCLHKLLVSRRRIATADSQAKARKDRRQSGELLIALCEQRPYELRDLWTELNGRGPKWRARTAEAVALLDADTGSSAAREKLEAIVGPILPRG